MPDLDKTINGLVDVKAFLQARADMAVGDGKMLLFSWCKATEDALELLAKLRPRLLTQKEAKALKIGSVVWIEQSGGHVGTSYKAHPVTLYSVARNMVMFHGGYAALFWDGYNREFCGFRFWTAEHSDEQRLSAKWDA